MNEFGTYLRGQRKRAGLTQQQLAECAGIDFTYISKLENNAAPAPSIQTLRRMADAFGITDAQMCAAAGRLDSDMTKQELERYVAQLLAMHENNQAAYNAHIDAQQDDIARLRAALGWYADENNYHKAIPGTVTHGKDADFHMADMGQRARAALDTEAGR